MNLYTQNTEPPDDNWRILAYDEDGDEEAKRKTEQANASLNDFLVGLLQSENLIILTGLGTTMYLDDAPRMSDLWDAVKQATDDTDREDKIEFSEVLTKVKYSPSSSGDNIEDLLSRCQISEQMASNKEIKKFIALAEEVIAEKCRFVSPGDSLPVHEDFLRRIAGRSTYKSRTRLFTLNYDLCFEIAAANIDFAKIDGFSLSSPRQFSPAYFDYDFVHRADDNKSPHFIPNVFQFYKLHGSINWTMRRNGSILQHSKPKSPLLIYPRSSKFRLSYSQPFLEMMSRFQIALRKPNTGLLIIGFGFNDDHLAQPILSAIRSNSSLRLLMVDPCLSDDELNSSITFIKSLIEKNDSRLAFLDSKFEDFVPLLPNIKVKSEEDIHLERIKTTGEST